MVANDKIIMSKLVYKRWRLIHYLIV
jgi:hypothetical protein